jgi:hypothetical protein
MSYLAERELNKSTSDNVKQEHRDVEEGAENAKVKQEIENTFKEDFHPAILGKEICYDSRSMTLFVQAICPLYPVN